MSKILYAPRLLICRLEPSLETKFGYIVDTVNIVSKTTLYNDNEPIKETSTYSVEFQDREFSRYAYYTDFGENECDEILYKSNMLFSRPEECKILVDKLNEKLFKKYEDSKYVSQQDIEHYKQVLKFEQRLAQDSWADELKQ